MNGSGREGEAEGIGSGVEVGAAKDVEMMTESESDEVG